MVYESIQKDTHRAPYFVIRNGINHLLGDILVSFGSLALIYKKQVQSIKTTYLNDACLIGTIDSFYSIKVTANLISVHHTYQ